MSICSCSITIAAACLVNICIIPGVHSVTVDNVRLTGGSAPNSGIVEVLTEDGWLPVCSTVAIFPEYTDDEFSVFTWDSHTESRVLCRQLGYDATLTPSIYTNNM